MEIGDADILEGGDGKDKLSGGAGDNTIDGRLNSDTASFQKSPAGIAASLLTNSAAGEGSDTLACIEHLAGSRYADQLTGSDR
jgi:Ca2+-binding RTX toxin-like protein